MRAAEGVRENGEKAKKKNEKGVRSCNEISEGN
jgi:hypothetical protein